MHRLCYFRSELQELNGDVKYHHVKYFVCRRDRTRSPDLSFDLLRFSFGLWRDDPTRTPRIRGSCETQYQR